MKRTRRGFIAAAAALPLAPAPQGTWITFTPPPRDPAYQRDVEWLARRMIEATALAYGVPVHILEGRAAP